MTVRELIQTDNLKEALVILLKVTKTLDKDLYQTTIINSGAYHGIEKRLKNGSIRESEYFYQKSRIKNSLIYVIDKIESLV